jgi:hypothetical protein
VLTVIAAAIVTSPVTRMTVPLGTVQVLFTVTLENWSELLLAGGEVTQLVALLMVSAPSEPSP